MCVPEGGGACCAGSLGYALGVTLGSPPDLRRTEPFSLCPLGRKHAVLCGRQVALWNRKRIRALVAEGETEAERDEIFQEEKEAN